MTEPICLRKLTLSDEAAFKAAVESWNDPEFVFASGYKDGMEFSLYLAQLENEEQGINLALDRVPGTVRYAFLDDRIVGRTSIRHRLNDYLLQFGGHIGYGVLPDFRRRGFATSILRHSLGIAKDLGLTRVLVTCNDTNTGSIRVIENCGGVLENTVPEGSRKTRRYWISL